MEMFSFHDSLRLLVRLRPTAPPCGEKDELHVITQYFVLKDSGRNSPHNEDLITCSLHTHCSSGTHEQRWIYSMMMLTKVISNIVKLCSYQQHIASNSISCNCRSTTVTTSTSTTYKW